MIEIDKIDENKVCDELLYELSECRQDERDSQNQIIQTLATAAAALTVILGTSIFGSSKIENLPYYSKWGIYFLCLFILLAAVFYVISFGIKNTLRYHYIRELEDKISVLFPNNSASLVHWMSLDAAINTRNIKHIFISPYTVISFGAYTFAIIFAVLFCLGVTIIQYFVLGFKTIALLIIPSVLMVSALTIYIFMTVKAKKIYSFAYRYSKCIYRSDCPLCTDFLPTLAASAHGAAHKLNNILAT